MLSFVLDKWLGVEWLGYMVYIGYMFNFYETIKVISTKIALLYITTSNVREFQLLHILHIT